jgi:hypothetical protein
MCSEENLPGLQNPPSRRSPSIHERFALTATSGEKEAAICGEWPLVVHERTLILRFFFPPLTLIS